MHSSKIICYHCFTLVGPELIPDAAKSHSVAKITISQGSLTLCNVPYLRLGGCLARRSCLLLSLLASALRNQLLHISCHDAAVRTSCCGLADVYACLARKLLCIWAGYHSPTCTHTAAAQQVSISPFSAHVHTVQAPVSIQVSMYFAMCTAWFSTWTSFPSL